ncbi:MAG TPA: Gfo/Idh/MocA family oxidoreductase [Candidatus Brocadiaceae bacterium]|nr:Gfo/Idh/MocA family oxidoreductase [Candidatus Brocadiaceae bacterium]
MAYRKQIKVKFALIGCGNIASKHITAIRRLDDAEVVGLYDIDFQTAKALGEKFSIPTFPSVEKMVETASPDFLNILTPSGDHFERIMDMTRFNKHFVVEKPLALRIEHIDRILEECDKRSLRIAVAHQNRFNPPIVKLKEALNKGRFGKLVLGTVRLRWSRNQAYYDQRPWRGTWAMDGGVLTNQASHHIDMLAWMMGDVENVMAKTARRLVTIEAEDTGVVIMKFRNGALGVIEATTETRPKDLEGSLSILGEKGTVEIGGFFMNELKTWDFCEPDDMDTTVWEQFAKVPDMLAWNVTEFYKDLINCHYSGVAGLIDGIEGRKSVELINSIYESAEIGKKVSLRFSPDKCRLGITNEQYDKNYR